MKPTWTLLVLCHEAERINFNKELEKKPYEYWDQDRFVLLRYAPAYLILIPDMESRRWQQVYN